MSEASRAAEAKLNEAQSLQYGDYQVTKTWKYAKMTVNGKTKVFAFNPNNPSEKILISDPNGPEAQQLYDYLKNEGGETDVYTAATYYPDQVPKQESFANQGNPEVAYNSALGNTLASIAQEPTKVNNVYQDTYDETKANQTTPASQTEGRAQAKTVNINGQNYREGSKAHLEALQQPNTQTPNAQLAAVSKSLETMQRAQAAGMVVNNDTTAEDAQRYLGEPVQSYGLTTTGGSTGQFADQIKNNALLSDKLAKDPALKEWLDSQDATTQGMFVQMYGELEKAIEAGKVVNPNIEITPQKLKQFMDTATSELDPYYKEQYGIIKSDLDSSIGRLMEDYTKGVERAQDPFKQGLKDQAQAESEMGTVYGSERVRREQTAVQDQTNLLDDYATQTKRSAEDLLRGYEGTVGSPLTRSLNIPSIQGYQASNMGTFAPTSSRSINVPYGNVELGSLGRERGTAVKTRAQELEEIYRSGQVLNRQPLS